MTGPSARPDAWHVVMAGVMAVMLLPPATATATPTAAVTSTMGHL